MINNNFSGLHMLDLYPLTKPVEEIVNVLSKNITHDRKDVLLFIEWVAAELVVNAKLISCILHPEFQLPTFELLYKKDYLTVENVLYKKHWTLKGDSELYMIMLGELQARIRRLELRPI